MVTDPIDVALRHVINFHPEVTMVTYYPNGIWAYTDDDGDAPSHLSPGVQVGILEAGLEAVARLPYARRYEPPQATDVPFILDLLSLWELMLDRRDDIPGLREKWEDLGTVEMRDLAVRLHPVLNETYEVYKRIWGEFEGPYDWEFIPAVIASLNWSDTRPEVVNTLQLAHAVRAPLVEGGWAHDL
jgi:hypothetical protein